AVVKRIPAEKHPAVGGAEDAGDLTQRRSLAGAVGPEEAVQHAARHLQGDVVHGHEAAVVLRQVLQADHGTSSLSRPIRRVSSTWRARPPMPNRTRAASAGN